MGFSELNRMAEAIPRGRRYFLDTKFEIFHNRESLWERVDLSNCRDLHEICDGWYRDILLNCKASYSGKLPECEHLADKDNQNGFRYCRAGFDKKMYYAVRMGNNIGMIELVINDY